MTEGLRIYNLFPTLAGVIRDWMVHLPRIAAMRFNAVYVNPFHYPGFSGSLYAVKDYYRLNPRFRDGERGDDDTLLRGFTDAARAHGLRVIMDLVINHTSKDSELVTLHPDWFTRDAKGDVVSPGAIDPADARRQTVWGDLAELDYRPPHQRQILGYFQQLVRHYVGLGFGGFRCDAAYKVPAEVWRGLADSAKAASPNVVFCAETLGAPKEKIFALAEAGFDYLFNSVKWWDFKSPWLFDQYEAFRHIAPSIGFPESHDTKRLVTELLAAGIPDSLIEPHYRQAYAFAAAYSTGVLMPMGFEYGWSRALDVVRTRDDEPERKRFDLSGFIAEVNAVKQAIPALNEEGPQRLLSSRGDSLVTLERQTESGKDRAFILVNRHESEPREAPLATLGAKGLTLTDLSPCRRQNGAETKIGTRLVVEPLDVRVLHATVSPPPEARLRAPHPSPLPTNREREGRADPWIESGKESEGLEMGREPPWRPELRIAIEDVYPEIERGGHPIKRVLGDELEIQADIFCDGHDQLRAVVKFAVEDQVWRETPLILFDNDRWVGHIRLDQLGLWRYTIEAWIDRFESWRDDLEKKRQAAQDVELELIEGRAIIAAALRQAGPDDTAQLRTVLRNFDSSDSRQRVELMLSPGLRELMARCQPRGEAVRYARELEIVVDRPAARFAAWYEMFPRSQGKVPGKSASFEDCIARLPEIAELGFDVVYLVPIHPIGRINRKGKNNSTVAGPGDPGSPYAIGSVEGGHRAVNPELGTLSDFRRFVRAAAMLGIEVALDFAIQCAPDHPWVHEHPEWFRFRPDGTIKYAENPPKKYQDIVNVDFYNPDRAGLWEELRDTVMFWIGEGVRTFRVDNPHTKPLPFWEWLIRDVKRRCPEAIFLSEAFTRPKMMRALARAGFTQSYTYFTWRDNKTELIDYLTELTRGPAKEYFRPNFFTNTPDILPVFLQQGGRPAFRIRLVLAATLSGVYGIYNGFELCENTPVPGLEEPVASEQQEFIELYGSTPPPAREEYLNSEKYEYKVWDWDRPGNIKADIRILNRFRRDNPALQEFLNLRFLDCQDPNILAYAKTSADLANIVVVAVNLDPHAAHESEVELPLAAFGLPADAEFSLEEGFTQRVVTCRGARQRLYLDPETNPSMIFRLLPTATK
jgi:starch synthase (maltosyl-transferring)